MSARHNAGFRLQTKVVAPAGCLTASRTAEFKDSVCFSKASEHLHFSAALCLGFPAGGKGPELLSEVLR